MKNILCNLTYSFLVLLICNCATTPPPQLTYLALEKPTKVIRTTEMKGLKEEFSRGGFYFWNYNYRPAADIKAYIAQAEQKENTTILKNTDIHLNVPFAFDILFFGINNGTDYLTTDKQITKENN